MCSSVKKAPMATALPSIEVIAVIENPMQFTSRYALYQTFAAALGNQQGCTVRLWTVELQHGKRPAAITQSDNERHIQLWTSAIPGEIWHKENLINLALIFITRADPTWRYVAWVDADFLWEPDAFAKTIEALQDYDLVQMWSHLINLSPTGGILQGRVGTSFMFNYLNGIPTTPAGQYPPWIGSPGGAWAARRESLGKLGCGLSSPLIDWGILGAGDLYLALSLTGLLKPYLDPKFSPGYSGPMYAYQTNALNALGRNIGVIENTVRHMWHGRTSDRQYETRGQILVKYQFDPSTDLRRDVSGVLQLVTNTSRQQSIRDACRAHFRARKEDATTAS
jgi:hypothetical protein